VQCAPALVFAVCVALPLSACRFDHGHVPGDAALVDAVDASGDARTDARTFDPATDCPKSYALSLPSSPTRYRVVQTPSPPWPHFAVCDADLQNATHAVVLGSMQEITELDAALDAMNTVARFYVGGVQSPTATTMAGDWIAFDGAPLLQTAWHTNENEPDDGGDGSENQTSQLLIIDRNLAYLHDAAGLSSYGVICECDGVPVHPTAASYVALDPNNPN
jgi:hypothetical protein